MSKPGKKYTAAAKKVERSVSLPVNDALAKLKELAFAKFDESVDVNVNLTIDATKGEQTVRGSVFLPYQIAKSPRIIVFAKGDQAELAQKAGADLVGAQDLIEKIEQGWMEFDYAVATPDMMGAVGKLAPILGPRGLLPNKKLGTVTLEVTGIIEDLKKGRLFFKNDKSGIVHFKFGKVSLDKEKLQENLVAFVRALISVKPATAKGKYLKKITVSSTMGPGISINPDELMRALS
jgi:large subunit ribosomal protein L1